MMENNPTPEMMDIEQKDPLSLIPKGVRHLFSDRVFEIMAYTPMEIIVADFERKQTVGYIIGRNNNGDSFIRKEFVAINAVPASVLYFRDKDRYEIWFETPTGIFKSGPSIVRNILKRLKDEGVCYDFRYAQGAFSAIIIALKRAGKVEYILE